MRLTFGMQLDGTEWSDLMASAGVVQLGPEGLLSLLETHLGLTGIRSHPARRIRQYMTRIMETSGAGEYHEASFGEDPWSTAKQMLALRDELVEAGWNGKDHSTFSPRMHAIAVLEQSPLPLDPGREDRLRTVLDSLTQGRAVPIARLDVIDPRKSLPKVWQRLLDILENSGIEIVDVPLPSVEGGGTNLRRLQGALSKETVDGGISATDDTVLLLEADTEWDAAETLTAWLRALPEENRSVTIIAGADTGILDDCLHRHGLPRLGMGETSRWRGVLQVLPLVLANTWAPLDIHRLIELLTLPRSPIHWSDARELLRALRKEPGVGGAKWKEALEAIGKSAESRATNKGQKNPEKIGKDKAASLQSKLVDDRHDPKMGIPEAVLIERCEWVLNWLNTRIESGDLDTEDVEIFQEARAQTKEFVSLAMGSGRLTRVAVRRILDSVIGVGTRATDRYEEAAGWNVVRHPGQITRLTGTLIWWGFSDGGAGHVNYWSDSERKAMMELGVELPHGGGGRLLEAITWRRGFLHASERVLLFSPTQMGGEKLFHHSFWDELLAAAYMVTPDEDEHDVKARLSRHCRDFRLTPDFSLARRHIQWVEVERQQESSPPARLNIAADSIEVPDHLSYTQMSNMISCPARWVMDKHLALRSADAFSLPTGSQMIGSLCHRIVELLYDTPGKVWQEDAAGERASELFDILVPQMAAELSADDRGVARARFRRGVAVAIRRLVAQINRLGLTVESTERELTSELNAIPFTGRVDMLLRTKEGNAFVFDLKWTDYPKYRKAEIVEGHALQLAAYAWLLKANGETGETGSGYFMLAQGVFYSTSPLLGSDALQSAREPDEIWERGSRSWEEEYRMLKSGTLNVRGVMELQKAEVDGVDLDTVRGTLTMEADSAGRLYMQPCAFCDFGTLCGMKEGAV